MSNPVVTPFSWSEKMIHNLRRSPQKVAMLGGLAVVLIVMWSRMIVGAHGPGGAAGATAPMPIMTAPNDLPALGRADHTTMLLQWARLPIVPMRRNLFAIPFDYYADEQSHPVTAGNDGFWGLLAKSLSLQADQQTQRQAQIDGIQNSARSLQLQSIMFGAAPTAMINGEMVREGSIIEGTGFRILKIEQQRIIVENEGIKLAISMQ
jgi:hypothetical protein